ncbi:hypothetical protein DV515_00016812, partial [Chloebia gouldiae]
ALLEHHPDAGVARRDFPQRFQGRAHGLWAQWLRGRSDFEQAPTGIGRFTSLSLSLSLPGSYSGRHPGWGLCRAARSARPVPSRAVPPPPCRTARNEQSQRRNIYRLNRKGFWGGGCLIWLEAAFFSFRAGFSGPFVPEDFSKGVAPALSRLPPLRASGGRRLPRAAVLPPCGHGPVLQPPQPAPCPSPLAAGLGRARGGSGRRAGRAEGASAAVPEKNGSGEGGPAGPVSAGGGGVVAALTGRGRAASEQGCAPFAEPRAPLSSRRERPPCAGKIPPGRRRSGTLALPAPPAALLGTSSEPAPPRPVPAPPPPGPAPLQGNAGAHGSIGAEPALEVPEPSPRPQEQRCPSRELTGAQHGRLRPLCLAAFRKERDLQSPEQSAGEWEARKAWAKDGLKPGCLFVHKETFFIHAAKTNTWYTLGLPRWENGPCWLLCPRWAESSDLGQMGCKLFEGVIGRDGF